MPERLAKTASQGCGRWIATLRNGSVFPVLAALVLGHSACAAARPSSSEFQTLEGHWRCEGHFVSNGKRISSDISFHLDQATGAEIVRHDDHAPGQYHALESWAASSAGAGLRAAIVDRFSGMRWFQSPGWNGPTLNWSRIEEGRIAEQFAYRFLATGELRVDWSVSRSGGPLTLGDTLTCRNNRAAAA